MSDQIQISIYVRRDRHDNGMTLKDYADAVMAGTHSILDHDQFVYQFGAVAEEIELVKNWALTLGLEVLEADVSRATVKVKGPKTVFNQQFGISLFDVVEHDRTYVNHTGTVIIPDAIAPVVENVLGFDQSFVAVPNLTEFVPEQVPNNVDPSIYVSPVTPPQVAAAYNIPAGDGYGGCIGIFELSYSGYVTGWNQTDVNASFNRIGVTPPTIVNVNLDGASASTISDAESMLDIYCAGAVAPKAQIVYYTAPNGGISYINDIINYAATDIVNNPTVLSISWGIGDSTYFDTAMQACVVKGVTVIVSSGDHGATGSAIDSGSCTSPYAVIAGGTNTGISGTTLLGESGWSGSGGGISAYQSLPSWQTGLTYQTKSNIGVLSSNISLTRRGIPDFSAPADPYTGYQFYVNNALLQYGGTSASAPWIAGMIVRLNQLLGRRIGLPMALFYSNRSAFNDIVVGDNVGSYTIGYNTTTGWDAVTGIGTPNGPAFYALFRNGTVFPKRNYGFRPKSGSLYPRSIGSQIKR
jgi:kumamolisin